MQNAYPNLLLFTLLELALSEMHGQAGGCSAAGASPNCVPRGEQSCCQALDGSTDVAVALQSPEGQGFARCSMKHMAGLGTGL